MHPMLHLAPASRPMPKKKVCDNTSKHRKRNARVKAIHSSEPAARDEGPRLIPLRDEITEAPMNHYLELADTALDSKIKEKKKAAAKAAGAVKADIG